MKITMGVKSEHKPNSDNHCGAGHNNGQDNANDNSELPTPMTMASPSPLLSTQSSSTLSTPLTLKTPPLLLPLSSSSVPPSSQNEYLARGEREGEGAEIEITRRMRTPILDFYRNRTVFITGGTGFIGKVLVQKLLRTFELKKIYLLIRIKDNMNVNQRLESFFKEPIFDKIREDNPDLLKKVHAIQANFNAMDLDIFPEDKLVLCNEVEIVFNVVASVKFNEKLADAIAINVLGTKKVLDLVMEMKNLKAFLHVSTLYSNCNRAVINEKVYEPEIGYEKIIQLHRIMDDINLEKMTHCLIDPMPNTYTMTKRCSENLVNHKAFFIPAGIFRPPIVLSTYKDPIPGWTDNLYGPAGLCTWSAKGFLHCILGNSRKKANLVPVDYCTNAMICAAWDVSRRYKLKKYRDQGTEMPVYNYIFDRNNLTWGQYMYLARQGFHEPFDKALWYFAYIIVPSKLLHRLATVLVHDIPGRILDLIAMATGQKRIYSKGYMKMAKVTDLMSYFGLREWKFSNENIEELDSILLPEEKSILEFNLNSVNWKEYFRAYLSGIRKYFFKEKDGKLGKNRVIYMWFYIAHLVLKSTCGILLLLALRKIVRRFIWIEMIKSRLTKAYYRYTLKKE